MKFIPGGTLRSYTGRPIPYPAAARLLAPVARALEYAHQAGVVHRDVKPANILLSQQGQPMLSDFGIARILESGEGGTLTATGVGIGTPEYMSPEQALGQKVDGRADIYALGIVFYELVTGRKPYTADTPMAVLYKHMSDPLPRPRQVVPDLPVEVENILYKALAKQPDDRYQSMGGFAAVLEQLAQGAALPAAPLSHLEDAGTLSAPAVPVTPTPSSTRGATFPRPQQPTQPEPIAASTASQPAIRPAVPTPATPTRAAAEPASKPTARRKFPIWGWAILMIGGLGLLGILALGGVAYLKFGQAGKPAQQPTPSEVAAWWTPHPPEVGPQVPTARHATSTFFLAVAPPILTPVRVTEAPTQAGSKGFGGGGFDFPDGMTIVNVPEGEFLMGLSDDQKNSLLKQYTGLSAFMLEYEQPLHKVWLDAFWIDQTEVTNAQYQKCVAAGACEPPSDFESQRRNINEKVKSYYDNPDYSNYPVIYVTWTQAKTYCEWAGRRLPTEAEWEKAARGTEGQLYPWKKDDLYCGLANYYSCKWDTDQVGIHPEGASPYGALDMLGNVSEWVADWYDHKYYQSSASRNPQGPASGEGRAFRGCSYECTPETMRTTFRLPLSPEDDSWDIGFRCAVSP